jgi:hypothetical protein
VIVTAQEAKISTAEATGLITGVFTIKFRIVYAAPPASKIARESVAIVTRM